MKLGPDVWEALGCVVVGCILAWACLQVSNRVVLFVVRVLELLRTTAAVKEPVAVKAD